MVAPVPVPFAFLSLEALMVRVVTAVFFFDSRSLFDTSGLLRDFVLARVVFSVVSLGCRWLTSYSGGAAVPFVVNADNCDLFLAGILPHGYLLLWVPP